ncbi:hypothetical protein [Mycoplasma seminis]|uniref:Uncharacterized protein n=1 Tax=Mycoplasma seminis TaxID=512749 RepID=A0ABY9HAQ7_9MOLU|nr:hypothetical protein [Mycoplasma seminis]WLP85654.1 hypothetical protein Q8852_00635 [Mycoplasma seminis]
MKKTFIWKNPQAKNNEQVIIQVNGEGGKSKELKIGTLNSVKKQCPIFEDILNKISNFPLPEEMYQEVNKEIVMGILTTFAKLADSNEEGIRQRQAEVDKFEKEMMDSHDHITTTESHAYEFFHEIYVNFNPYGYLKDSVKKECFEKFSISEFYKMGLGNVFILPHEIEELDHVRDINKYVELYFGVKGMMEYRKFRDNFWKSIVARTEELEGLSFILFNNRFVVWTSNLIRNKYSFYLSTVSDFHSTLIKFIMYLIYIGGARHNDSDVENLDNIMDFIFNYNKNVTINKLNQKSGVRWENNGINSKYRKYFAEGIEIVLGEKNV